MAVVYFTYLKHLCSCLAYVSFHSWCCPHWWRCPVHMLPLLKGLLFTKVCFHMCSCVCLCVTSKMQSWQETLIIRGAPVKMLNRNLAVTLVSVQLFALYFTEFRNGFLNYRNKCSNHRSQTCIAAKWKAFFFKKKIRNKNWFLLATVLFARTILHSLLNVKTILMNMVRFSVLQIWKSISQIW